MDDHPRKLVYCMCLFTLSLTLAVGVPEALAQQQNCTEKLAQAEQFYVEVQPEEAIALLTECIETNEFTQEQRQRAHRLLALSYISNEQFDEARDAVRDLLRFAPDYQVDLVQDPPVFVTLIEEIRPQIAPPVVAEQPKRKGGISKWLIIGGGVVAGGVLAAVLAGGGGGNGNGNGNGPPPPPTIAAPPPLPGGN